MTSVGTFLDDVSWAILAHLCLDHTAKHQAKLQLAGESLQPCSPFLGTGHYSIPSWQCVIPLMVVVT